MKRLSFIFIAVLCAAGFQPMRAQDSAHVDKEMASAQHKATIDGDLAGAIKQYQAIVNQYSKTNRAAAARALMAMAESYQKLGDTQATKIWERVVKEFADQHASAGEARARLAAIPGQPAAALGPRVVGTGGGRLSADERTMVLIQGGEVVTRDMATGRITRITLAPPPSLPGQPVPARPHSPVLSQDSKQIAYAQGSEFRVVPNEPGATARVLFRNTEFEYLDPRAWSLDGKAVLTAMQKAVERTWQFAWVSTATGAITVIESVGWAYTDHYDVLNLSPDGRYIAYSAQAVNPAKNFSIEEQAPLQRRVYVLASDGSSKVELLKTADARMPVWTPDNAHLVFLSDLSGRPGLWSIPVRAGKAAGVPSMVRAGIDDIFPIAITRAGTFYYYRQTAGYSAVSIANLNSGASSASEVLVGQGPVWSPDGTAIALSRPKPGVRGAQSGFNVGFNLVVHSFETGEELLFEGPMAPAGPRWFHDRRRLLVPIRDSSQAAGATPGSGAWHAVDPKTGTSTRILAPDPLRVGVIALSGDDTTVYSLSRQESDPPGPQRLVATELATGRSRQVFDFSSLSSLGTDRRNWALSPDGRTLAYQTSSATESHLGLILLESGTYQALYRGPKVTTTGPQWVNDGKFIAWGETVARGRGRLMRMSIAGGSPEFTGTELEFEFGFPRISPNGLRIATPISVPSARELWALDNVTALIKGAR